MSDQPSAPEQKKPTLKEIDNALSTALFELGKAEYLANVKRMQLLDSACTLANMKNEAERAVAAELATKNTRAESVPAPGLALVKDPS